MLVVARKYSKVVDSITADKALKLRKYKLSEDQWAIVDDLIHVLEIFKNTTLLFLKDNISTIAQVILMIDVIDNFFSNMPTCTVHAAIKSALCLAQSMLDQYYSRTDESNVYCTGMTLHPKLKLAYFRNCGWEKAWINNAEWILHKEFTYYNDLTTNVNNSGKVTVSLWL
ncbi:hypothetical protein BT96DRAFT_840165 [Gymnopus androsaceus JB14]|uniref:hAT-like transposase RNase-H fold domain-containing protein n=1 Tax=Gymnopus androsaceus JB14 TaxID=1447944 RepID=A0A6A4GKJ0_9AGAR|nr:hypothetical protein BT96DRAFT_840165 [Gymnopus androsaceus JB14]